MKRSVLIVGGLAIVVAAAGIAASFLPTASSKPTAAAPPKPALTVTTTRPAPMALPAALAANGSIAAWQEATIGAEVAGLRLAEVRVNVGDVVRRGAVLATFASETVEADLAVQRAQAAEAEASLADARANAERARSLATSGALSAQQISQYLTGEQTARARLEAARAQVKVQELRLRHTQVVAPDDGVISARTATVGAVVNAGTELFRLVRQGRLEWRAEVTATELARVKPGMNVKVTPAGGATVTGRVRMVGPTVDAQTRNALVYVDLPAGGAARAGMFARGEFEMGATDGLTVPQDAVVVRDGFNYVFTLGTDNRVTQVKVQTGRRAGERIEVTGGLAPDATIVATGAGFLADGDLVAVTQSPAKTASAAGASTANPAGASTANPTGASTANPTGSPTPNAAGAPR
jgi:HlyD family secretion protein